MKIITLIGSNRAQKSTSAALTGYMEQQLSAQSHDISRHYARSMFRNQEKRDTFLAELQGMSSEDLLIITAPNYVDSLPAPLLNLFEETLILLGEKALTGKRLLAVFHSGYPERQQRQAGLQIMRCFAKKMGMQWCGGLSFGGTSPIDGQPLENAGPFARKIPPVLDRTVKKITSGELSETDALFLEDVSALPIPLWAAVLMMNTLTRRKARKEKQNIRIQPYKDGSGK